MKKVELTATTRTSQGTKGAAALRRNKRVPCVLYGGGETLHFSVEEAALSKAVHSPEAFQFELDIDGTKRLAQIQEKQFHPTSDRLLHVDFLEMHADKEARVNLSLRLTGQSAGVRKGGKLTQPLRKLRVKGLPAALPQHLEYDVTELELGQSIRVKDLKFPGLTVAEKPSDVVVSVKAPKKDKEAEAAAAAAAAGAAPAKSGAPAKAAPKK
ncbi:MAG TPA: 50S ribosomal protein L25 [Flavobacteriales bacterium]